MEENAKAKTIIAEDIKIVGTIHCESDIQFDGRLEGDLHCTGKATIGKTAKIKGNATVDSVSLLGEVAGNITAKDRIELKATARLQGDIKAKRLTVEDGVTFIGRSEVNPAGVTPGKTAPASTAPETQSTNPSGTSQQQQQRGK